MAQKRAHTKRTTSTEAAGNLTEREKGSFCFFWLLMFRIMHVMRNLGKWKKPISRIFGVPASAGSFFGLVQPFYAFCTFYHILLFYLSHTYRQVVPVLCAVESVRFWFMLVRLFLQLLCVCFIVIHAAPYNLQFAVAFVHSSWFLRWHGLIRFWQNLLRTLLYGCWLLIMQIIRTYDVIRSSRIAP